MPPALAAEEAGEVGEEEATEVGEEAGEVGEEEVVVVVEGWQKQQAVLLMVEA
jgi:hypothetical protein